MGVLNGGNGEKALVDLIGRILIIPVYEGGFSACSFFRSPSGPSLVTDLVTLDERVQSRGPHPQKLCRIGLVTSSDPEGLFDKVDLIKLGRLVEIDPIPRKADLKVPEVVVCFGVFQRLKLADRGPKRSDYFAKRHQVLFRSLCRISVP